MTMQTPRKRLDELSPTEQAELLARLRQKFRLKKVIKTEMFATRTRREEIQTMRNTARQLRAEARDKRHKSASSIANQLDHQRRVVQRRERRAHHLAYGFLRGRDYVAMEALCYERPNWARVEEIMVEHSRGYEPQVIKQRFAQWKSGADEHFFPDGVPKSPRKLKGIESAIARLEELTGQPSATSLNPP